MVNSIKKFGVYKNRDPGNYVVPISEERVIASTGSVIGVEISGSTDPEEIAPTLSAGELPEGYKIRLIFRTDDVESIGDWVATLDDQCAQILMDRVAEILGV